MKNFTINGQTPRDFATNASDKQVLAAKRAVTEFALGQAMDSTKTLLLLLFSAVLVSPVQAQTKLTETQAKDHVGETATVCGSVVSTRYAASTRGQPTFLNLDKPYPGQVFTVVIWGSNRSKFGAPETDYKGKRICVTGKIAEYRGMPEVAADDPKQIQIETKK